MLGYGICWPRIFQGEMFFTSVGGQTGKSVERKELFLGEQVIKYGKAILLR